MTEAGLHSRIHGCVLGAALGDAIGAPFEFRLPMDQVSRAGSPWIDALHPFTGEVGPHGIWRSPAPPGTGTDDTRYNWLFLELAAELRRMPSAKELAGRFLEVHERPASFFPEHPELATSQFEAWEGVCQGQLGQKSSVHPGVPPDILRDRSIGLNFPTLMGLITCTSAGLLFPGRPADAYRAAFMTDFVDLGYARECVAILASAISMAVTGRADVDDILEAALDLDPFDLGGPFGEPFARDSLRAFLQVGRDCSTPEDLAESLSRDLARLHPFDPVRTLAIAFAATSAAPTDTLTAILIAANHRAVDEAGNLGGFLDVDCYATVAGALSGAMTGTGTLPLTMLADVVRGNTEVYGFDLLESIDRLIERCA
jgi:ADP-ribosylglycohydrolase